MVCVWLRAAPALRVRSLLHECRPGLPVHYRRRASLTAFVNNTGAGRATREGALTGSRAYGLMLLPGMFQPSHSNTVNSAGCLAMYPPVSI